MKVNNKIQIENTPRERQTTTEEEKKWSKAKRKVIALLAKEYGVIGMAFVNLETVLQKLLLFILLL